MYIVLTKYVHKFLQSLAGLKMFCRARDARARHVRRLVLSFDEVRRVVAASVSEHEPMSRVRLYSAESTAVPSALSRVSCGSSNDARRACRLESSSVRS